MTRHITHHHCRGAWTADCGDNDNTDDTTTDDATSTSTTTTAITTSSSSSLSSFHKGLNKALRERDHALTAAVAVMVLLVVSVDFA